MQPFVPVLRLEPSKRWEKRISIFVELTKSLCVVPRPFKESNSEKHVADCKDWAVLAHVAEELVPTNEVDY